MRWDRTVGTRASREKEEEELFCSYTFTTENYDVTQLARD